MQAGVTWAGVPEKASVCGMSFLGCVGMSRGEKRPRAP